MFLRNSLLKAIFVNATDTSNGLADQPYSDICATVSPTDFGWSKKESFANILNLFLISSTAIVVGDENSGS